MAFKPPIQEEAKMNLTPMIDMTFLLVVFFMLTIDLSQKEFLPVELPYARKGVEDKEEGSKVPRLVVNLLQNGDIGFKGHIWPLGGNASPADQVKTLQALRNELQTLTANPKFREADRSSEIPVMIHGDRNATWQYVQWIMAVCAEPSIGVYKVQFAVRKPPNEQNQ